MTGELCDIFPTRAEGVARLSAKIAALLPGEIRIYGGRDGWLSVNAAAANADAVASANWHATASLTARRRPDALFVDMGSTTTDIIPIVGGKVAARGFTDASAHAGGRARLYRRDPHVPDGGCAARSVPRRWTPVMNEYFGSMADVSSRPRRAARQALTCMPTADGREKTAAASMARLARMIGRDAGEAEEWEWRGLAAFFAEAQLRTIARCGAAGSFFRALPEDAPVVAAGAGRFVVESLAARLGRQCENWEALVPADAKLGAAISDCAPAVAVALLLAADRKQ